MVETIGRCDTPKECIENLLHVKQMHFPDQSIDWDHLIDEFVKPSLFNLSGDLFQEQMHFLVTCSLTTRVKALAFKVWRDYITNMIRIPFESMGDNSVILRGILAKVAHFEEELPKLKVS